MRTAWPSPARSQCGTAPVCVLQSPYFGRPLVDLGQGASLHDATGCNHLPPQIASQRQSMAHGRGLCMQCCPPCWISDVCCGCGQAVGVMGQVQWAPQRRRRCALPGPAQHARSAALRQSMAHGRGLCMQCCPPCWISDVCCGCGQAVGVMGQVQWAPQRGRRCALPGPALHARSEAA